MPRVKTKPAMTYNLGDDFDYSKWSPDTVLTLVTVPWPNDYRDAVPFANQAALDSWIDARADKRVIENVSYARFDRNVTINVPINDAMNYNYLRAVNPVQPGIGGRARTYYYFIQRADYYAGNSTLLTLQLDVWQTYIRDIKLGLCYVNRGHIGIANENAFNNYGRDYLTTPEGLDIGGEYRIVKTARQTVMDINTAQTLYSVLVISTVDLTVQAGTKDDPIIQPSKGSTIDGISIGASAYVFPTGADFKNFMKAYAAFPWVTENIISATIIPNIQRYFPAANFTNVAADVQNAVALPGDGGVTIVNPPDFVMYNYPTDLTSRKSYALSTAWRDALTNIIPAEYRMLKKFLTFPYTTVELTTWTGKALVARPEVWADNDATITEQASMLPPGQRIAFIPSRYNADSATTAEVDDDNGEWLDFSITIDGFVSIPVVNNQALLYLAANRNGIAFQYQNADWSQQKAQQTANAGFENSSAGIANTRRQAGIANRATAAQAELQSQTLLNVNGIDAIGRMTGGGMAAATNPANAGALPGSIVGAGMSALAAGVQADAITSGGGITRSARSAAAGSNVQSASSVRDTNMDLAYSLAQGDYDNQIAGINAKLQDIRLTQPSLVGQFGGDAMNLTHSNAEISVRFKMVDEAAIQRIGDIWLRYGYNIDRFINFNDMPIMCMTKFTYIKMTQTYLQSASIPEMFKSTIRAIFEKGVTLWADPAYIGMTALADNQPINGISY